MTGVQRIGLLLWAGLLLYCGYGTWLRLASERCFS